MTRCRKGRLPIWLCMLVGCQSAPARDAPTCGACTEELAEIRDELADLRAEVHALSGRPRSKLDRTSATGQAFTTAERPGQVTWTFQVEPSDAQISVAGERLEGATWTGPRATEPLRVRVRKPGYRVLEQLVSPDRDRTLEYRLLRGRGLQRL